MTMNKAVDQVAFKITRKVAAERRARAAEIIAEMMTEAPEVLREELTAMSGRA